MRAVISWKRLAALCFCLHGCSVAVLAQDSPTTLAPTVHVLVVDENGAWRADRQERFALPKLANSTSLAAPGASELARAAENIQQPAETEAARSEPPARERHLTTDWKSLVDTRPFRLLAYDQRLRLLEHPERLLSSSWASAYFSGRHVLVLRPLGNERVEGHLYDLATGQEKAIVNSVESGRPDPRERALSEALEQAGIASESVLAHPEGLYHRASASHLSSAVHYEPVESARRAEAYGFLACGLCYPQRSRDALYDDLDLALGEMVAIQVERSYPLIAEDDPALRRVRRVGQRLLQRNRFLDQGYRFEVLDSDSVNAYAAPTGPIYVTRGLLQGLRSDDELAAVLGHELSHSERRHGRQQYLQSRQTGMVGLVITVATGVPLASLGTDLLGTIMGRGYSRGFELESDRDGMMSAYAAGYRPEAYLRVQEHLEDLQRERGGGGAGWLRTHPGGKQRKEQLSDILERSAPLRERLEKLQGWDWGMAVYLKGRVLIFLDDPSELYDYLDRYARFADPVERVAPPGRYSGETPAEVWWAVRDLLAPPPPPSGSGPQVEEEGGAEPGDAPRKSEEGRPEGGPSPTS